MENVDVVEETMHFYYGSQVGGEYAWIFPKGNKTANVELAVPGSKRMAKKPITYLNDFVEKSCHSAQPLGLVLSGTVISDEFRTQLHSMDRGPIGCPGQKRPER
jgi:digeranylgeranylglycerophospholipid reductase